MAYNRPYNPDELPRFAEPENKNGGPSPRNSGYEKPAPPLPRQEHQRPSTIPSPQYRHDSQSSHHRLSPSHYGAASPPPMASGPRPTHHTRPPTDNRPPPSPDAASGGASDPKLLPLFRAVDKDGTGHLSEAELSAALVNGDWSAFDPQTVRMMIRMFDSDRSGTIGFEEFCGLWSFLASWRTLFDRFDVDRSGNISLEEFTNALVAFRYRLSSSFVELVFRTYDKRNEGVMSFDLFVQACISLKRMTDVFKKYDDDRDGYITLSFEDFLSEILKQMR
ncbi:related to programmed cell death protein (calcium-binding protein) [Cephalotrichum gorgonifer]|uniref:Related to programmed cell death protein (Calcium-binding protein) n=1 Tax=Cephalotrichum gorgonifer TaxID=2041049 RepID=A0AAE8MRH6_9PEZI|nr:related to programmed cell death protein (calcium-binding protein) [Cephalotrichum gorgonifer]